MTSSNSPYLDANEEDEADAGSTALPSWIDGAGTKANYEAALGLISANLNPNGADGIFLWSSNHGSTAIPEPGTLGLLVSGLLGIAVLGTRRRLHPPK